MKFNTRGFAVGALTLVGLLTVTAFQNCAQDLPEAQVLQQASMQPLDLVSPKTDFNLAEVSQLQATGGKPPYTFEILSGPATVDPATGALTVGSALGSVVVQVKDSLGNMIAKTFTVGQGYAATITPGTMTFNVPGTYTFTVPAYVKLSVDVRGAGGGGGGSNVDTLPGTSGTAGGLSQFLDVRGLGGAAGQGCNYYGGVNFYPSGAAPGSAGQGGDTNTTGGGAAGGIATVYGFSRGQDGGAGGRAVKVFTVGVGSAPAPGMRVTVTVGAGGAAGQSGTY